MDKLIPYIGKKLKNELKNCFDKIEGFDINNYNAICEPCAGSFNFSLVYDNDNIEKIFLNDIDDYTHQLLKMFINNSPDEINSIFDKMDNFIYSDKDKNARRKRFKNFTFNDIEDVTTLIDVELFKKYYLSKRSYRVSLEVNKDFPNKIKGINDNVIDNLKNIYKKIEFKHLDIFEYFDYLEKTVSQDKLRSLLIYLDPPYVNVSSTADLYGHWDVDTWYKFANILKQTKIKWVLNISANEYIKMLFNNSLKTDNKNYFVGEYDKKRPMSGRVEKVYVLTNI